MPSPETISIINLIIIFLFLLTGFIKPFFGLLSYLMIMMTRVGLEYPFLGEIRIELLIALIVLIQLYFKGKLFTQKLYWGYDTVNKYVWLFLVVILASFAQAWDYEYSWTFTVIEILKVYAFFIMIVCMMETEENIRLFLWIFALATVLTNYEGVYSYLQGQATYVFREVPVSIGGSGLAEGHVQAANIQLQCLPIMFYLMLSERRIILKVMAGALFLFSLFGIIAAASRGAFYGLIFFSLMVAYLSKRKILSFVVCAAAIIISLPFLGGTYVGWMGSVVDYDQELSAGSRIGGLIAGIEMMVRRPLLGVGPGCYPLARKQWFGWGLHAHNHLGQLAGDLGLLGIIVWGLFIYHVFKNLQKAANNYKENNKYRMFLLVTGLQVSLIVRLFLGIGSHSLYIFYWHMFAALSILLLKFTSGTQRTEGENTFKLVPRRK